MVKTVSQSPSHVWLFATPWTAAHQASLSFTNSLSLPKLMSIESVISSNHLILCRPLLLPSVFPSIRVFSNESALHIRWPKYWSFSISPLSEYSGLISFRIDWFSLLAVQGLSRVFSSTTIWQHQFFSAQPSLQSTVTSIHDYWKNHMGKPLTIWTFVGQVMSLLFNTWSRFVTVFLPTSKHFLISWLQSLSPVILEPKKRKSVTASTFPLLFATK